MSRLLLGLLLDLIVFALTVVVAVPPVSSVAVSVTTPLPFFWAFFSAGATMVPTLFATSFVVVAPAAPPVVTVQLALQRALIANFFLILNGAGSAFRVGLAWLMCSVQPLQLPLVRLFAPASITVSAQTPALGIPLNVDSGCAGRPLTVVGLACSAVQKAGLEIASAAESLIVKADVFG